MPTNYYVAAHTNTILEHSSKFRACHGHSVSLFASYIAATLPVCQTQWGANDRLIGMQ